MSHNHSSQKTSNGVRLFGFAAGFTITAIALAVACGPGVDDDRDCDTRSTVLIFSTSDHRYHYGSPTGKLVPANKVPSSARKVPGYKPYTPPKPKAPAKPAAPKADNKPAAPAKPADPKPAAPAAPKPRR